MRNTLIEDVPINARMTADEKLLLGLSVAVGAMAEAHSGDLGDAVAEAVIQWAREKGWTTQ